MSNNEAILAVRRNVLGKGSIAFGPKFIDRHAPPPPRVVFQIQDGDKVFMSQ
jgi:hypothetical protein